MNCPSCQGQMRISYSKGFTALWKCPFCGYATLGASIEKNKNNNSKAEDSGKKELDKGSSV